MDTPTKTCRTCQVEKPHGEFSTTDKNRGYLYPHCKPCQAAKKRAERAADPDKHNAYQRERYYAHHEQRKADARKANLRHYHKMRDSVLEVLGSACAECGQDDVGVLQIDHIHGGGSEHRKNRGDHGALRDIWHACRDTPDAAKGLYQLLCGNCHHRKSYARTHAPHS